jgi:hypothetical protein
MRRNINYVLIAEPLTGDSKVMFYKTKKEARMAFNTLTKPFIKACKYVPEASETKTSVDTYGIRFNQGYCDTLDDLLPHGNKYIEWGWIKADKNITHYFAEYSEWVDDSYIVFLTKKEAIDRYEIMINDGIVNLNDNQDTDKLAKYVDKVKRYDQSTWETEDGQTLFDESEQNNKAFFGFSLFYYTIERNEITY